MRSELVLRSPSNGTGWSDSWVFSGADDRALRDCLDQLVDFATDPPPERWDRRPDEPSERHKISFGTISAEAAWTVDRALRLAELLPERLRDLRVDILARFAP